jgi:hypothetical protein
MLSIKTLALAFVIGLFAIANGQTPPGRGEDLAQPTNLTVEVYYSANEPPAYLVVSPVNSPPSGSSFGRFRKVPDWHVPPGALPVTAVDIKTLLTGSAVRISISVLMGRLNEQEKSVAVYSLREGERVRVSELAQFGVEPFELALVRVASANADLPQFVSKAPSIELVTIQANLSTLPSHRLVLRNISGKNVRAIMVRTLQDRVMKLSGTRQGKEGNPLIPAGGTAEITQRAISRATATPGGYKPVTPENQTIEISSAIFEDGSYEGDAEAAVQYRAFLKGQKSQLVRVVALFQEACENGESDPRNLFDSLRNKIAQLKTDADPADVQELLNEFPGFTRKAELMEAVEFEMLYLRKDVLDDISRFLVQHPTLDSNSLRAWLAASKQRYADWLSRL